MEEKSERAKTDWIGLIAFLLIVIGGVALSYYYITEKINVCTGNPVRFAVDKFAEEKNISDYELAVVNIYKNRFDFVPIVSFEVNNSEFYK